MTPRALLVTEFKRALDAFSWAAQHDDQEATDRARGEVESAFFKALAYQERQ